MMPRDVPAIKYDQRSILADERNIVEKFRGKRVLYLAHRRGERVVKIGISQNPRKRVYEISQRFGGYFVVARTWQHHNPSQIEAIACVLWKDNCIDGRELMAASLDEAEKHIDAVIRLCGAARNNYQFVRYMVRLLGDQAVEDGLRLLQKHPGLSDKGGRHLRSVLGLRNKNWTDARAALPEELQTASLPTLTRIFYPEGRDPSRKGQGGRPKTEQR